MENTDPPMPGREDFASESQAVAKEEEISQTIHDECERKCSEYAGEENAFLRKALSIQLLQWETDET